MAKKSKKRSYNCTCAECGKAFKGKYPSANLCGCIQHQCSECPKYFTPSRTTHYTHSSLCAGRRTHRLKRERDEAQLQEETIQAEKAQPTTEPVTDMIVLNDPSDATEQMILENRTRDSEPLIELFKEAQSVRNNIELFQFRKFVEENYATGRVDLEQVLGMLPSHAKASGSSLAAAMLRRVLREVPQVPENSTSD